MIDFYSKGICRSVGVINNFKIFVTRHSKTLEQQVKDVQAVDNTSLFREMTVEKFPYCVKKKVTATYAASGWIAAQRIFRYIVWRKIWRRVDSLEEKIDLADEVFRE